MKFTDGYWSVKKEMTPSLRSGVRRQQEKWR